jgi:hypothetical protein
VKARVRITRDLYREVLHDLRRPHPHAAERVGFLFARCDRGLDGEYLILAHDYTPLADERYLIDPSVGARIDDTAIRSAMQRALTQGDGAFHVHLHDHLGRPGFSRVDRRELWPLMPPFQVVRPDGAHGVLVWSADNVAGVAWLPGATSPVPVGSVTVVGFPMGLLGGDGQ